MAIDNNSKENFKIIYKAIEKFTSTAKILSVRRKGKEVLKITDEYDIQDILLVILKPHYPDIKREEVVRGNRNETFLKIDFVISTLKVAIECKYVRSPIDIKGLTMQLNDDIQTYHKHQDCNHLIFFIYDKEHAIPNPDNLENEYSKDETFGGKKMTIELKIRPKN